MEFSSLIQVIKVNEVVKGVSAKTQKAWERHSAECICMDDKGGVAFVGRLVIPQDLVESVKVGQYTASFGLHVPTYGDQKGDITARLTGLVPIPAVKAPMAQPKA